ncbi:hypothetical protein [Herbaspirillum chlorophenolicum]|nr:hypothetical protein [Herbaspirillum chlorophenolicum]
MEVSSVVPRQTIPHHHNLLGKDALFTTPTSLMLDVRLTPLEHNS